jgi:hypothetical protein
MEKPNEMDYRSVIQTRQTGRERDRDTNIKGKHMQTLYNRPNQRDQQNQTSEPDGAGIRSFTNYIQQNYFQTKAFPYQIISSTVTASHTKPSRLRGNPQKRRAEEHSQHTEPRL